MELSSGLDQALRRAGIPIIGVRIGLVADRSTWIVQFAANATAQHRTDAAAIVAAYNPATDTPGLDDELMARIDGDKLLRSIVIWCAGKFNISVSTARTEIRAIYRNQ